MFDFKPSETPIYDDEMPGEVMDRIIAAVHVEQWEREFSTGGAA